MTSIKSSFVVAIFILVLSSAAVFGAPVPEQTISGTMLSERGEFSCDHCLVTLLANGGRPAATAYLDSAGHFAFPRVPAGSYTIHAEIEGFEEVNQPVDANDGLGLGTNVLIT